MKSKYKYLLCFTVVLLILWSSMGTKTTYSKTSQLKLISKEVELDTIKQDSYKRSNIQFLKMKKEPLLISKIKTSTKNINIQQTLQYFPKGDTLFIPLVFHTKIKVGNIQETITLYGNFPEKEITIPVSGYIK